METSSASWKAGGGIGEAPPADDGPPLRENAIRYRPNVDTARFRLRPLDAPVPVCAYSGDAADGLPDPYVQSPATGPPDGGKSNNSTGVTDPPSVPPVEWHKWPVKGGVVQFTRRLTAHGSAANRTIGRCSVSCSLGPYTVAVHAQPYNLALNGYTGSTGHHDAVEADTSAGTLTFHYFFKSTDGNTADLTSITISELLDFSGNSQGGYDASGNYFLPSPPVALQDNGDPYAYKTPDKLPNPTDRTLAGFVFDTFSPPTTGFIAPYSALIWHLTQKYVFDDSATGEVNTLIPGPDNQSPFTITRSVTPGTNRATGTYTLTTRGYPVTKSLP